MLGLLNIGGGAMQGTLLANRYLVTEELGSGGMGTVYLARDQRTGAPVAIKFPHPWLVKDPSFVARLRREAQIAASLVSPRVVRVYDFNFHEDRPFLVMEYVPGPTLDEILEQRGPLAWEEAARIALEVARALTAAHQQRIVHRDLKPENIKIGEDGAVKVLDFGIARAEGAAYVTMHSVFVGTPEYMAPERFGITTDPGERADETTGGDIRSDIYALGCVLYAMLTGAPPFTGPTVWAVIRAHERSTPTPLDEAIPPELRAIVARCLNRQPALRYQEPRELVLALRAVLGEEGPITRGERLPSPPAPGGATAGERISPLMLVVVVLILLALVGGVLFATFGRGAPPPASTPAGGIPAAPLLLREAERLAGIVSGEDGSDAAQPDDNQRLGDAGHTQQRGARAPHQPQHQQDTVEEHA